MTEQDGPQDVTEQEGTDDVVSATDDEDALDAALNRLDEAEPGDTDEVLDAGNEVFERLQERLRETDPQ